ncbi:hypothetical protein RB653_005991 [Dictyostelium firmibasis]|uniref:Uncharacterized protein n=1 Tax=Dictyostelium firmibasis TaxID=79012 RepID=A0AAN7UB97_9MYCE
MENNFIFDSINGDNITTDSINSSVYSLQSSVSSTISNKSINEQKYINDQENDQKKEILEIIDLSDYTPEIIKNKIEIEDLNNKKINKIDGKIGFLIFILGMGNMLPFHTFLASLDYLDGIFPQYKMSSTFPFIYMVVVCLTFIILLRFQNKFKAHLILSSGFPCYISIMILTPIVIITSHSPITTYLIILLFMGLCAVIDGLCQGTIFSYASRFGPQYSLIAQTGTGVASVVVVITRLTCKLSFSSDNNGKKIGSVVYFVISAIIILIAITTFFFSLKIEKIRKILITNNDKNQNEVENSNITTIGRDEIIVDNKSKEEKHHPFKEVFKKTYGFGFMVFYNFFIVLFLFPGIIIQIKSLNGIRSDWWIFIMISVYNISDCLGKMLISMLHRFIIPLKIVWSILFGKTIFVLLFFLCIYYDKFNHEPMVLVFLILFGFISGTLVSYGVSEGPKRVDQKLKPTCSVFLSLSLNLGLMLGSSLNLLVSFFM